MDSLNLRQRILLNQPHIESATGDIASFTTNMKAPLKECKVYFEPIQEGEGDPSPDNIRNIVGWNGINLYKCKKNLVLENSIIDNFYVRGAVTQTGTEVGSTNQASGYKCTNFIKVLPNTAYTITFTWINAAAAGLAFYSNAKVESVISGISMIAMKKSPYTFITPSNCNYIKFTSRNLNSFMGLVQGSTELTEDVYDGTNISTTWSDSVGTVYGGYLDLVNGILTVTNQINIINNSRIVRDTATRYHITKSYIGNINSLAFARMNKFRHHLTSDGWDASGTFFLDSNNLQMNAYQEFDTKADFIEAYGELQLCYTLAEPIYYQLTPQQLLTFKGENNIWSDTNGQTEVKFWTH